MGLKAILVKVYITHYYPNKAVRGTNVSIVKHSCPVIDMDQDIGLGVRDLCSLVRSVS